MKVFDHDLMTIAFHDTFIIDTFESHARPWDRLRDCKIRSAARVGRSKFRYPMKKDHSRDFKTPQSEIKKKKHNRLSEADLRSRTNIPTEFLV